MNGFSGVNNISLENMTITIVDCLLLPPLLLVYVTDLFLELVCEWITLVLSNIARDSPLKVARVEFFNETLFLICNQQ